MQVKFAEALKSAMSRAASEASADMEGQWLVRVEEKAAEYVRREKQLVADLNAERERTRALQDRVIDMERHTAQTTAELDVVKRENTSLQGSLARAREEFSVRQFAPPSKPPVQHHHQQMDQTFGSSILVPPHAPSTSFLGSASLGLPLPNASLDDSRRMLAIQNQIQLMRAKADAVFSMNTTNHNQRRTAAAGSVGGEGMENSLVSVSMLSDVTQDNDLNLVDNIAPVRGVSNKTAQILASLNLNASVGQSRPGLSVGLGRLPTNEGRASVDSQLAASPSTSPARVSRGQHTALDQKQSQFGELNGSRLGGLGGRLSGTGWYQRGYWKTRYNLGGGRR